MSEDWEALAQRLALRREQVQAASKLLDDGLPPIFIAHYRKVATGGLDEAPVRRLAAAREALGALEALRRRARGEAERAGSLSDDLARTIDEATGAEVLEDILQTFKPGRRTAASVAEERGLAPLAQYARNGPADGPDLPEKGAEFVNHEKEVHTSEDALAGAAHILAERISKDHRVRQAVRRLARGKGVLRSRKAKQAGKSSAEFRGYFNFSEPVAHLPPHRILAINRGERQKALKVSIDVPRDAILQEVVPMVVPAPLGVPPEGVPLKGTLKGTEHRFAAFLNGAVTDALDRLVLPAIDRETRHRLTERAEEHAIEVFAANLRSLLMTPPLRGTRVMTIHPGFRSGCKVAVLDADGSLLAETIIYPHEPKKKRLEGKTALVTILRDHQVRTIAIGNGTGCRDTEELVSEIIEEHRLDAEYAIVNEAGAGVYADSPMAKEEFPNLDAAIRVTVSIGRRLQDPLAELVKIDPRAVGVGLYQHDVDQEKLRRTLEETVESCVCAVGADANTASPAMLRYVPGLGDLQIQSLCARRAEAPLASRDELRTLPGWDDRTFQLAAGFLRVRGVNPLGATRIHPESYPAAERLLERFGHRPEDLKSPDSARKLERDLTGVSLEPLAGELEMPLLDLVDLVGALQRPDFDLRSKHPRPIFRRKIRRIEDLTPGMWVKGTVRNVVDFGAFVDIGLKEDGLIHISQFSRRYVRNPMKFLHVGDVVDARVVTIDAERHRIALTLIPEEKPEPKREAKPVAAKPAAAAPAGASAATAASPSVEPATAGESAAQPPASGGPPKPKPPAVERRLPTKQTRTKRSPRAEGGTRRQQASPSGRSSRPRKAGPAAGPRKDRAKRGPDESRVLVFRDEPGETAPERDEKGRPKIRWAHYDSGPQDADASADESDDAVEEQDET